MTDLLTPLQTTSTPDDATRTDVPASPTPRQAQFAELGYLSPITVFTKPECRRIMRALRRDSLPAPVDWPKGKAVSSRVYHEIGTRPDILSVVKELIGPDVVYWGASLVRRAPGEMHAWHTDLESSSPTGKTVSVWIGVEFSSVRSALRVISRSHKLGVSIQEVGQRQGLRRRYASEEHVLAWARRLDPACTLDGPDVGVGDALFFDGRLWHGSHNNNRCFVRSALLLQYASADTPIRIPEELAYEQWPFYFKEQPKPACIMVEGTTTQETNRIVPGPTPEAYNDLPLLSSRVATLGPMPSDEAWASTCLFKGSTRQLKYLKCHASVLGEGHTPHDPHVHKEEEVLVVLDGEPEIHLSSDTKSSDVQRHTLQRGDVVYYPTSQHHTIHTPGATPSTYVMFKWYTERNRHSDDLQTAYIGTREKLQTPPPDGKRMQERLLDGSTSYLRRLRSHITVLQPGDGYAPHIDAYDVCIVVLEGEVETLGQRVGPNGIIFYAAGEPHGMRSVGDVPARYVVFEFHGGYSDLLQKRDFGFLLWRLRMASFSGLKRHAKRMLIRIPGVRSLSTKRRRKEPTMRKYG